MKIHRKEKQKAKYMIFNFSIANFFYFKKFVNKNHKICIIWFQQVAKSREPWVFNILYSQMSFIAKFQILAESFYG
jgi:hypothetical protein